LRLRLRHDGEFSAIPVSNFNGDFTGESSLQAQSQQPTLEQASLHEPNASEPCANGARGASNRKGASRQPTQRAK
jgi:hypothetical protein